MDQSFQWLFLMTVCYGVAIPFMLYPENPTRDYFAKVKPYLRSADDPKKPSYPVILVPGDGGSRLRANLTGKPSVVHYACDKKTADYFDLWLNIEEMVPIIIDCWADNMKLKFNNKTLMSENNDGVDVKIDGFGDTDTVEWLDSSRWSPGRYFVTIVDALESWGYRRGKNVIGAPFDWRKSPRELNEYYIELRTMIEMVHRYNNNSRVVILAHSMGNPVMNYFYHNYVNQDWKNKFIEAHVSLAGAWGGSMQIVKLYSSGYNMDYFRVILPPSSLRPMQRSFTSSALLFPSEKLWAANESLVITPTKNYTISDIEEFFNDIQYPTGFLQYGANKDSLILDAPGIEMHCIYGTDMKTAGKFTWYKKDFPEYQPDKIEYEDGDGTVNIRSLETCKSWNSENNNGKVVQQYSLSKADHMSILWDKRTMSTLLTILYPK